MAVVLAVISLAFSIVPWHWGDSVFTYSCDPTLARAFDTWEAEAGIYDGGCSETPEIEMRVLDPWPYPYRIYGNTTLYVRYEGSKELSYALIEVPSDYNFEIVLHELGHALGLDHSENPDSAMYRYCCHSFLSPDDIAAAQSLYGPHVEPIVPKFRLAVPMVAK